MSYRNHRKELRAAIMGDRTIIRTAMIDQVIFEPELVQKMKTVQRNYDEYQALCERLYSELQVEAEVTRCGLLSNERKAMADFYLELEDSVEEYIIQLRLRRGASGEDPGELLEEKPPDDNVEPDEDEFETFEVELAEMDTAIVSIQDNLQQALAKRTAIMDKMHSSMQEQEIAKDNDRATSPERRLSPERRAERRWSPERRAERRLSPERRAERRLSPERRTERRLSGKVTFDPTSMSTPREDIRERDSWRGTGRVRTLKKEDEFMRYPDGPPMRGTSRYSLDMDPRCREDTRHRERERYQDYDVRSNYRAREHAYSPLTDRLSDYLHHSLSLEESHGMSAGGARGLGYSGSLSAMSASAVNLVKRVEVPTFNGNFKEYRSWRETFDRLVDALDIPPDFKMMHLRKSLKDTAREVLYDLGCSAVSYTVVLQRLERRYGGERRQSSLQMDDINSFKPVRSGNATDLEKFAELLDVVVVDLVESGNTANWGGQYLYMTLQRKLNESLLIAYRKWLREYRNPSNIESLRLFVMEESEDQVATMETFRGVAASHQARPERSGPQSAQSRTRRHGGAAMLTVTPTGDTQNRDMSLNCRLCDQSHGLWACKEFGALNVDQRWEKAKELKVCFRCLSRTHRSDKCMRSRICGLSGCKDYHHRLLHENKGPAQAKAPQHRQTPGPSATFTATPRKAPAAQASSAPSRPGATKEGSPMLAAHVRRRCEGAVSLRSVPVILRSGDHQVRINAVIDDGSTKTFVNECVAMELQLSGRPTPLVVSVINNQRAELDSMSVNLTIQSDSGEVDKEICVHTVPNVLGSTRAVDWAKLRGEWQHLAAMPFPELPKDAAIDMLIGLDNVNLHDTKDEVHGVPGEPVARRTPLGWTCVGPVRSSGVTMAIQQVLCTVEESQLSQLVRRMWEMDGVVETPNMSVDERAAMKIVQDNIQDCQGHYQVKLPWRTGECFLPKSRNTAYHRLLQTEKKLRRDPAMVEAYCKVIDGHIQKGYIEEVPEEEEHCTTTPLAYIPHFAIIRPDAASTKVRVVFDASAETDGVSLNDYLYTGPKLQADIVQVLQRLRRYQVAVGCDVAEMFLQVRLHPSEHNAHRFLWRSMDPESRVRTFRHLSLMFGSKPSPYIAHEVSHKNAEKHKEQYPLAAEAVKEATYMDDGMDSCKNVPQAVQLCVELKALWGHAGMKVHKWLSSSPEVLQSLPPEQWAKTMMPGAGETPLTKTLGLKWEATEDYFTFQVVPPPADLVITKRSFLSKTASLYDPLGLICPFVVKARLLLQDMWLAGVGWDDTLPRELQAAAEDWFQELPQLALLRVPRALVGHSGAVVRTELHTFTHASQQAYGAVTYVVHHYDDGTTTSRLALAKVKIAPLDMISIPRLELMAAVKGLSTTESIRDTIGWEIARIRYWTDSLDVICWIRGNSRQYKPFVGNRIGEIHRRSDPDAWHHVPTLDNPADKLSRGVEAPVLLEDAQWWEGPPFLQKEDSHWPPPLGPVKQDPALISKEGRQRRYVTLLSQVTSAATAPELDWTDTRLHPSRYSVLTHFVRTVAWVRRFVYNARRSGKSARDLLPLSADELQDTEQLIVRTAQRESFCEDIRRLTGGGAVTKNSPLVSLAPTLDRDGMLRGGTRLPMAEQIPWATKYPLLLPRDSDVTRLVIQRAHDAANHAGTNYVLAQLSVRYWILSGREAIRSYERECMTCRRRRA